MLVREATELRRLGRVISRREATIREVHHRVKNNLQTVASLLRLQARRLGDHPQAVAALEDSVHRITSIALVHETLTEEFEGAVDMADVARRVVRMLEGSLGREDVHIELHTASVRVDAAVATPLAVVLNELIQNAIEHGLGDGRGTVSIRLSGGDDQPVILEVRDNGTGGTRDPPTGRSGPRAGTPPTGRGGGPLPPTGCAGASPPGCAGASPAGRGNPHPPMVGPPERGVARGSRGSTRLSTAPTGPAAPAALAAGSRTGRHSRWWAGAAAGQGIG